VTEGRPAQEGLPALSLSDVPKLFGGPMDWVRATSVRTRDWRLRICYRGSARKDGKRASDGVSFMVLGIDHPYAVVGDETFAAA